MKKFLLLFLISVPVISKSQDLKLNEREYFERQGINVLVFSNNFNGGFNDEKNSGIEIIHHGVRTIQGGAVRLEKNSGIEIIHHGVRTIQGGAVRLL